MTISIKLAENEISLVEITDNSYINRDVIKKYCKIKNKVMHITLV